MLRFVVVLLACASCLAQQGGNVTMLGEVSIQGTLVTAQIKTTGLTIDGSATATHACTAETITTGRFKANTVEATALSSPTGTVHIQGQLVLGSSSGGGNIAANGTISASSFIQEDVKQWRLAVHEDFEGVVQGWSTDKTGSCDGNDHHLAGHCNHVGEEVKKTFKSLGEHSYLRLQARYHFLDSWEGETAFAKVNGRTVWMDTNDVRGMHPNTLNLCGGDHPDTKFSVPIDITIPHTTDDVEISFGSSLDESPCNESFGIDDVQISLR